VTTKFFVEIHRRGGHAPLIHYVDTEAKAKRLFASAPNRGRSAVTARTGE
jgi:hypothetical protein